MIINVQIIFLLNLISAGTSTLNDDDIPEDLQSNSNYSWINRAKSWMVRKKFCMEFFFFPLSFFFASFNHLSKNKIYYSRKKQNCIICRVNCCMSCLPFCWVLTRRLFVTVECGE